jgi:hypothetical protein
VRLLLDEMYSPEIARQLRSRDHDVVAVAERAELLSGSDREIFIRMSAERRAIVTNNVPDYMALFAEAIAAGADHYGLLLTDDRSMPRRRDAIGTFVRVLHECLQAHPPEDALRNQLRWLPTERA